MRVTDLNMVYHDCGRSYNGRSDRSEVFSTVVFMSHFRQARIGHYVYYSYALKAAVGPTYHIFLTLSI